MSEYNAENNLMPSLEGYQHLLSRLIASKENVNNAFDPSTQGIGNDNQQSGQGINDASSSELA